MELLDEIGTPERAEEVVRGKLARHERIMGFGHRVYKVEDPRATILREWSQRIGEAKGNLRYYELLREVEGVVHREKGLYPNVDLYSGSVYTLSGSRRTCSRRCSRRAASPAGPRTSSRSTRTSA